MIELFTKLREPLNQHSFNKRIIDIVAYYSPGIGLRLWEVSFGFDRIGDVFGDHSNVFVTST